MNSLSLAFWQTIRSVRLLWLIYGITLVLGLLVALPFYGTLKIEDQNSLAFMKLLDGFDYTVYSDFMQRSERTISPLISVGRWLGVLYVFLSVFFAGGILAQVAYLPHPFSVGLFWQGCSQYVRRFLQLFFVTLLFVVVGGGLWLVMGTLAGIALTDTLTERGLFWIGILFFALFALTATFLLCIGDYAKVIMFRENESNAFRAFGRAGRFVLRNMAKTYGLYILLILIGTALFGVYFLIDEAILMSNWFTIMGMLVVQQGLIFARVGLKVWSLGIAYSVYERIPKPVLSPTPVVEHIPESRSDDQQTLLPE